MARASTRARRVAEHLQRLVLRGGGEGEVAGVGEHLPRLHPLLQRIIDGVLRVGEGRAHGRGCFSALAAVGFVNDDRGHDHPLEQKHTRLV